MLDFNKNAKRIYALIILDGWGIAPIWGGNAIAISECNYYRDLLQRYPNTTLEASDGAVGLPHGAPGNSEAGHLNIGAGHIVHQDQPIIDEQIENGEFFKNKAILDAIEYARKNNSNLHIMGLLSKTGTHSHINHLFALLKMAKANNFNRVFIHLFSDGRDSDSMSGIEMVNEVELNAREIGVGQVVSVIGRFYAMDRDHRWDRIEKAYNLLVHNGGKAYSSSAAIFGESYSRGVTDEFIEASYVSNKECSFVPIRNGDSIIFFNFRSDRSKEITEYFLKRDLPEAKHRVMLQDLLFTTFVMHDEEQLGTEVFFPDKVIEPIAKIWSDAKLRQFHIAETEKYAHVTYFLNGGTEKPFPLEDRVMIPSPKNVKTYDQAPEMSAETLTDTLIDTIRKGDNDCYVVNYANTDMVGHTGNLKAAVKAVEFVDKCLSQVIPEILKRDGVVFLFADHGNVEQMVNPKTGDPDTEHTTNPVPFILISEDEKLKSVKLRRDGILASIAPTVLDIMGVGYDKSIKEKSLIISNNEQ